MAGRFPGDAGFGRGLELGLGLGLGCEVVHVRVGFVLRSVGTKVGDVSFGVLRGLRKREFK